jgi:hypothetical protein
MSQAAKTSVQGSDDTLSRLGELKYTTVDGLSVRLIMISFDFKLLRGAA